MILSDEVWETAVQRTRDGVERGYYRSESAESGSYPFPWQGKKCGDCPFWSSGVCRAEGSYRPSMSPTCRLFDPWNRAEGEAAVIIHDALRYQPLPNPPSEPTPQMGGQQPPPEPA